MKWLWLFYTGMTVTLEENLSARVCIENKVKLI